MFTRLISIIMVFMALCAGPVLADALVIPNDKAVITFESRTGDVTFAHRKHAELSTVECVTCHHKHEPGAATMRPCHDCHLPKSRNPPKAKKAFHTRCIGCHEYTVAEGQASGPVMKKCALCHVRE